MKKLELLNLLKTIEVADSKAKALASEELDKKMKPQKSLGILEDLDIKLAGIYGYPLRALEKKCHIVVVADNGIIEENVSSCPIEYTALVAEAMLNKIAAIGIFCDELKINLDVVNVGMKFDIPRDYKNFYNYRIRRGTNNFFKEAAMSEEDVLSAIELGINLIKEREAYDIFSNGEMGIANTTTSSAILYSLTKVDIDKIVGIGGGLTDEALKNKKNIIIKACEKYNTFDMDAIDVLKYVGGLDICVMVGMYIGCALYKKAMLVDGFISAVASLVAYKLNPKIADYFIFTHKSEEPGMEEILKLINDKTFLNLKMRLGEGTGAVFSYPFIDCAIRMINTMKTPKKVYEIFGGKNE